MDTPITHHEIFHIHINTGNQRLRSSVISIGISLILRENAMLFELLPTKFTLSELRGLYEAIYRKQFDIRNFCKKVARMPYVVRLNEKQTDVAHRAAFFYKFDRIAYNKTRQTID